MYGNGCPFLYLKFTLGHNYLSTKPIFKWETFLWLDVLSIAWGPRGIALLCDPGRWCQRSEAYFLSESLAGKGPHLSLSVLIWRQHTSFPSHGIWREFSEMALLGGEKLPHMQRGFWCSCQGDQKDPCLVNSLCFPHIL